MKKIYFSLFILFFASLVSYSQINITVSICGTNTFTMTGTDATGRNTYVDGSGNFSIEWSVGANSWEIIQGGVSVGYANTFASTPNPPCFGTGMWVVVTAGCGDVTDFSGDCQSTLTGISNPGENNAINVFPNPGTGQFKIAGLKNESTIEIYDFTGRLVLKTVTSENIYSIDFSGKNKGVYLYRITDKDNTISEGKVSIL